MIRIPDSDIKLSPDENLSSANDNNDNTGPLNSELAAFMALTASLTLRNLLKIVAQIRFPLGQQSAQVISLDIYRSPSDLAKSRMEALMAETQKLKGCVLGYNDSVFVGRMSGGRGPLNSSEELIRQRISHLTPLLKAAQTSEQFAALTDLNDFINDRQRGGKHAAPERIIRRELFTHFPQHEPALKPLTRPSLVRRIGKALLSLGSGLAKMTPFRR